MTDLTTYYLGLRLRSPIVASSSPVTGDPDALLALDDAGVGAVVLPSLFEEQVVHDALEVDRMLASGAEAFGEASGYFPELDTYNTGPDHYLARVHQAKQALEVPVIACLNAVRGGGWVTYGRMPVGGENADLAAGARMPDRHVDAWIGIGRPLVDHAPNDGLGGSVLVEDANAWRARVGHPLCHGSAERLAAHDDRSERTQV